MANSEYNCSQSSLYATCRTMWNNYLLFQPEFEAFKPKYTVLYGTNALAAVTTAQLIPDSQARGSAAEVAKINLTNNYGPAALLKWQILKSYIEEAYPNHSKPKLEEAGSKFYGLASNQNWEKLIQMMASGLTFLADAGNLADLGANLNMPAGFPASFAASKTAFDTEYDVFMGKQSGGKEGTVDKIAANNAVYQTAIRLSKDSPLVFPKAPETAGRMIFAEILRLVDGNVGGGTLNFEGSLDPGVRVALAVGGIKETSEVEITLGGNLAAVVGVWLDVDDSSAHDIVLPVQNGSITKVYTYGQLIKPGVTNPAVLKLENTGDLQVVPYTVVVRI